jgi:hypothetical protein
VRKANNETPKITQPNSIIQSPIPSQPNSNSQSVLATPTSARPASMAKRLQNITDREATDKQVDADLKRILLDFLKV